MRGARRGPVCPAPSPSSRSRVMCSSCPTGMSRITPPAPAARSERSCGEGMGKVPKHLRSGISRTLLRLCRKCNAKFVIIPVISAGSKPARRGGHHHSGRICWDHARIPSALPAPGLAPAPVRKKWLEMDRIVNIASAAGLPSSHAPRPPHPSRRRPHRRAASSQGRRSRAGRRHELRDHEPVPAKQKFAAHDFAAGDRVTMYGVTVGRTTAADPRGRPGQHGEPQARDQRHRGQAARRALDRAGCLALARPHLRRLQAPARPRGHGEPLDRHPARVLREPQPRLHARGVAARARLPQDRAV